MLNRKMVMLSVAAVALATANGRCQDPVPIYPDNYKVLLENDRVRVLDFKLRKGAKENFHSHPAAVTYVLESFKIRFTFPDGEMRIREAKAGEVFFGEALTHASENIGETDAHGILVEMKTPPSAGEKKAEGRTESKSEDAFLTAVTFIRGLAGKEDELKRELLALAAPTRAEPGSIRYDLYQSPVKRNEFMRLEVWRNPQALETHKATPHIQASFKRRQEQGWTTEITTWDRVPEDKR